MSSGNLEVALCRSGLLVSSVGAVGSLEAGRQASTAWEVVL
jgi:hypothetical protein